MEAATCAHTAEPVEQHTQTATSVFDGEHSAPISEDGFCKAFTEKGRVTSVTVNREPVSKSSTGSAVVTSACHGDGGSLATWLLST